MAQASFWSLKPWWCRPWSIVATGVAVSLASWLLLHRLWITLPTILAVLLWWWMFLLVVPAAYEEACRAQATGCISPPPGVESSSSS